MTSKTQTAETPVAKLSAVAVAVALKGLELCKAQDKAANAVSVHFINAVTVEKVTFEEIEAAQPELKKLGAYRSVKAVIVGCKKNGIKLTANGKARSKSELASALTKKKAGKKEEGGEEGGKEENAKVVEATPETTVHAAFGWLKLDRKLRHSFAEQIAQLAHQVAQEMAADKAAIAAKIVPVQKAG